MKSKLSITLSLFFFSLACFVRAEKFPFANDTFDTNGMLEEWDFDRVHEYYTDTIGNIAGLKGAALDNAADASKLGYKSEKVESKTFETDVDLTDIQGLVYIAIHVDDIATLTVTETLQGDEPADYAKYNETYHLKGSALWRSSQSFKKFETPILAGRKYKFKLDYENTVNLTKQYNGPIDYDGVSVFLMHEVVTGPIVRMISAPEYLFASAKHATPVKFEVLNVGNVKLESVSIKFDAGPTVSAPYVVGERFVANDGPARLNGQSSVYTCFIPSSFYKGMSVPTHKVIRNLDSGAKFRATVSFTTQDNNINYTDQVAINSAKVEKFIDEQVVCCDIGLTIETPVKTETQLVSQAGEARVKVITNSLATYKTNQEYDPSTYRWWGFDRPGDQAYAKSISLGQLFGAEACLWDDMDLSSYGPGQEYRARVYETRRGGVMFFSYRGRSHNVLDEGELAMDLNAETGGFRWELFGKVSYMGECESKASLPLQTQASLISGTSGIGWALVSGPWGAAFGTLSSVAAIYSALEVHAKNSSEVTINEVRGLILRESKTEEAPKVTNLINQFGTGYQPGTTNAIQDGGNCKVGNQYLYFIDIRVAVTAEALPGSENKSFASATYSTDTLEDYNSMKIISE